MSLLNCNKDILLVILSTVCDLRPLLLVSTYLRDITMKLPTFKFWRKYLRKYKSFTKIPNDKFIIMYGRRVHFQMLGTVREQHLQIASYYGRENMIRYICERLKYISYNCCENVMYNAVLSKKLSIIKLLLRLINGASLYIYDAMLTAISTMQHDMVQYMIKYYNNITLLYMLFICAVETGNLTTSTIIEKQIKRITKKMNIDEVKVFEISIENGATLYQCNTKYKTHTSVNSFKVKHLQIDDDYVYRPIF